MGRSAPKLGLPEADSTGTAAEPSPAKSGAGSDRRGGDRTGAPADAEAVLGADRRGTLAAGMGGGGPSLHMRRPPLPEPICGTFLHFREDRG